jgi:hypothetical protein
MQCGEMQCNGSIITLTELGQRLTQVVTADGKPGIATDSFRLAGWDPGHRCSNGQGGSPSDPYHLVFMVILRKTTCNCASIFNLPCPFPRGTSDWVYHYEVTAEDDPHSRYDDSQMSRSRHVYKTIMSNLSTTFLHSPLTLISLQLQLSTLQSTL